MKNFWLNRKADCDLWPHTVLTVDKADLTNLVISTETITVNPPYNGTYTILSYDTTTVPFEGTLVSGISIPFAPEQVSHYVVGCDMAMFQQPYKLIEDTNG